MPIGQDGRYYATQEALIAARTPQNSTLPPLAFNPRTQDISGFSQADQQAVQAAMAEGQRLGDIRHTLPGAVMWLNQQRGYQDQNDANIAAETSSWHASNQAEMNGGLRGTLVNFLSSPAVLGVPLAAGALLSAGGLGGFSAGGGMTGVSAGSAAEGGLTAGNALQAASYGNTAGSLLTAGGAGTGAAFDASGLAAGTYGAGSTIAGFAGSALSAGSALGGLLSFGGSVYSSIAGANAAKKAAGAISGAAGEGIAAQQAALQEQLKFQREALAQEDAHYQQALAMGQPYRSAGERALTQYESLLYGDQSTDAARTAELVKTPGYQFQMDEGNKSLERSAAARSGLLSGAEGKAMTRFGQGLASTSYNGFMDRLAGLSDQGARASGAAGGMAMQSGANQAGILQNMGTATGTNASNISGLLQDQGAARAGGYLGQQSAQTAGINNITQLIGQYFK